MSRLHGIRRFSRISDHDAVSGERLLAIEWWTDGGVAIHEALARTCHAVTEPPALVEFTFTAERGADCIIEAARFLAVDGSDRDVSALIFLSR